jgi:hypothetical protein
MRNANSVRNVKSVRTVKSVRSVNRYTDSGAAPYLSSLQMLHSVPESGRARGYISSARREGLLLPRQSKKGVAAGRLTPAAETLLRTRTRAR